MPGKNGARRESSSPAESIRGLAIQNKRGNKTATARDFRPRRNGFGPGSPNPLSKSGGIVSQNQNDSPQDGVQSPGQRGKSLDLHPRLFVEVYPDRRIIASAKPAERCLPCVNFVD